jgi:hypothetical protein
MKPFMYVVLEKQPKTKELRDKGIEPKPKLVFSEIRLVIAENEEKAKLIIAASLPDLAEKLDQLEILVRPF